MRRQANAGELVFPRPPNTEIEIFHRKSLSVVYIALFRCAGGGSACESPAASLPEA